MQKAGVKKRIEYNQIILNKDEYKIGDVVRINEYCDDSTFGKIKSIWKISNKPDVFAKISWFFKPLDVFQVLPEFVSTAELIDSDLEQNVSVETIYGKIELLTFRDYHLRDEVDLDVYFTRAFYDYKKKEMRPPLSQWPRSCICESIINPDLVYVNCDNCNELFHVQCVNYKQSQKWFCVKCES
jgi:hypothetical protein